MIGVLTHHWAKPDKIDEARKLLDRNGSAQSQAPGFVSRQTLIAEGDPTQITTLVVWTSADICFTQPAGARSMMVPTTPLRRFMNGRCCTPSGDRTPS